MKTVLHTESSPGLGGQEVRTLTEARWTAERGWRVLLVGQPDGASWIVRGPPASRSPAFACAARGILAPSAR